MSQPRAAAPEPEHAHPSPAAQAAAAAATAAGRRGSRAGRGEDHPYQAAHHHQGTRRPARAATSADHEGPDGDEHLRQRGDPVHRGGHRQRHLQAARLHLREGAARERRRRPQGGGRRAAAQAAREAARRGTEAPRAHRDLHGACRSRQDLAHGLHPQVAGRRGRGRGHHPAHRRLPGRLQGAADHLSRYARPRGLYGHARPRGECHGPRGACRRRR